MSATLLVMDIFGLGSERSPTARRPGRTSGSTRRPGIRASPPVQSGRGQRQGQGICAGTGTGVGFKAISFITTI